MFQLKKSIISCVAVMALSACGSGGSSGDDDGANEMQAPDAVETGDQVTDAQFGYVTPRGVEECSVEDINGRVEFDMRDYYIYYDSVAQLNQADFETPEEYIRALRVDPDIYSSVGNEATQTSFFEAGETQGYGFWIAPGEDELFRVRDVAKGSSVEAAGVLRGDQVISVNGIPYDEITNDQFAEAFPREEGNVANVVVRTGNEEPRQVEWSFGTYKVRTAGPSKRFSTLTNPNGNTIGYLPVGSFLVTTQGEIDEAFAELRAEGEIDELILDLRYNGGGRISVANYLASIIGGDTITNDLAAIYNYNDKYNFLDFGFFFEEVEFPLNLSRVIVLTTGASASSSEILINSLRPYMDVVVVGERTEGKPFISSQQPYCGKAINAMSAIGRNVNGVDVVGGIPATCEVEDTWDNPTDNENDALLRTALGVASGQGCGALVADSGSLLRNAAPSESRSRSDIPRATFAIQ